MSNSGDNTCEQLIQDTLQLLREAYGEKNVLFEDKSICITPPVAKANSDGLGLYILQKAKDFGVEAYYKSDDYRRNDSFDSVRNYYLAIDLNENNPVDIKNLAEALLAAEERLATLPDGRDGKEVRPVHSAYDLVETTGWAWVKTTENPYHREVLEPIIWEEKRPDDLEARRRKREMALGVALEIEKPEIEAWVARQQEMEKAAGAAEPITAIPSEWVTAESISEGREITKDGMRDALRDVFRNSY